MNLLRADNLVKEYTVPEPGAWFGSRRLRAVDGVSLELKAGETLGIVGESGSGKSTLGRMLVALEEPTSGEVFFEGRSLRRMRGRELREARRGFQMIFQDPLASINPRQRALDVVTEPLAVHERLKRSELEERAAALLLEVGLDPSMLRRFPHEFSGGQRQRLMIARAISTSPRLLVADEPVSSLDITIQAQILELLLKLKRERGMAMVFISHDLRVVERLSDRVAVMKDGRVVEQGNAAEIYARPAHPYTQALLKAAMPLPRDVVAALKGKP